MMSVGACTNLLRLVSRGLQVREVKEKLGSGVEEDRELAMKLLWGYVDGYAQQGHAWINRGK